MKTSTILLFACLIAYATAAPATEDRDKGDEGLGVDDTDAQKPVQTAQPTPPKEEGHGTHDDGLTPNQQGRLAHYNGDFFQLYGATNQMEGNLDAIAGNQLSFRGDLIEMLGNEHSLRELGDYLGEVETEREKDAAKSTGREKELESEEAKIIGDLRDLVVMSAGKEHEQAQEKAKQFNLETRQYRLEKEESQLKAQQAVGALDIGDLEEQQIRLENKGRESMIRLVEIEEEREKLEKEKGSPSVTPAAPAAPAPAPAPDAPPAPAASA